MTQIQGMGKLPPPAQGGHHDRVILPPFVFFGFLRTSCFRMVPVSCASQKDPRPLVTFWSSYPLRALLHKQGFSRQPSPRCMPPHGGDVQVTQRKVVDESAMNTGCRSGGKGAPRFTALRYWRAIVCRGEGGGGGEDGNEDMSDGDQFFGSQIPRVVHPCRLSGLGHTPPVDE